MATMSELCEAKAFLKKHFPSGARLLCAVSGGEDSMCLLHFLLAQEDYTVAAAHFNHLLRAERSDADQLFVERWCLENRVPFYVGEGDVGAYAAQSGKSVEEAGRELRYDFLRQTARDYGYDAILTAHHADDNAETVLLNLLRGTGTAGLGGIPAVNEGVYRPFLTTEKERLCAYAAAHDIPHVEDESNAEDTASRNILRHRVMPVLKELNPRAAANIGRAAAIAAEESAVMEALALETAKKGTAQALLEAPRAVAKRAALMMLGQAAGGRKDLTASHAQMLLDLVESGRGEAHFPRNVRACMDKKEGLRIFREILPEGEEPIVVGQSILWKGWRVTLRKEGGGAALHIPEGAAVRVGPWQRDDRMTLPGSRGSRSVKRLCAERGIPPALRDRLPVVRLDGKCAAMALLGIDVSFAPQKDSEAVYVEFLEIIEGETI